MKYQLSLSKLMLLAETFIFPGTLVFKLLSSLRMSYIGMGRFTQSSTLNALALAICSRF